MNDNYGHKCDGEYNPIFDPECSICGSYVYVMTLGLYQAAAYVIYGIN